VHDRRFDFAIDPRYARVLRLFGVRPGRAWILIDTERLHVRFGFWRFETPLANIDRARLTGPYRSALRAIGPHISLKDHGISFCTNTEQGVCILLREPVRGRETAGLVRYPGVTVTPADPAGFARELLATRDASSGA
jgi:hypothetical protein